MQFLNKSSKHLTENIVYSIHSSLIIKTLTPNNNNSDLIKKGVLFSDGVMTIYMSEKKCPRSK